MGCYNKFGEYDCRRPYPDRHRRQRFEEFGPRRPHGPCGPRPCNDYRRPLPPGPFFYGNPKIF